MTSEAVQARFSRELAYKKTRIDRDLALWKQIVPGQVSSAHYAMGLNFRGVGVYSLLLGDRDTGLKAFAVSADSYRLCVARGNEQTGMKRGSYYPGNEPGIFLRALYSAIISGNDQLIDSISDGILGMRSDIPDRYPVVSAGYHFARCMAGLALKKKEIARSSLASTAAANETLKLDFFGGACQYADGMLQGDAKSIAAGLNKVLEEHVTRIQRRPITDEDFVCLPAVAMLLMARSNGHAIAMPGLFVPDSFLAGR